MLLEDTLKQVLGYEGGIAEVESNPCGLPALLFGLMPISHITDAKLDAWMDVCDAVIAEHNLSKARIKKLGDPELVVPEIMTPPPSPNSNSSSSSPNETVIAVAASMPDESETIKSSTEATISVDPLTVGRTRLSVISGGQKLVEIEGKKCLGTSDLAQETSKSRLVDHKTHQNHPSSHLSAAEEDIFHNTTKKASITPESSKTGHSSIAEQLEEGARRIEGEEAKVVVKHRLRHKKKINFQELGTTTSASDTLEGCHQTRRDGEMVRDRAENGEKKKMKIRKDDGKRIISNIMQEVPLNTEKQIYVKVQRPLESLEKKEYDDEVIQMCKANAFNPLGYTVQKMSEDERKHFSEDQFLKLVRGKAAIAKARIPIAITKEKNFTPQRSGESKQHYRRRRLCMNHKAAGPILSGQIRTRRRREKSKKSLPAKVAAKMNRVWTAAKDWSFGDNDQTLKVDKPKPTFRYERIGRGMRKIAIYNLPSTSESLSECRHPSLWNVTTDSAVEKYRKPQVEISERKATQHQLFEDTNDNTLAIKQPINLEITKQVERFEKPKAEVQNTGISLAPLVMSPKLHRRKRSVIKGFFAPLFPTKTAATPHDVPKRITIDMIKVMGGQRMGELEFTHSMAPITVANSDAKPKPTTDIVPSKKLTKMGLTQPEPGWEFVIKSGGPYRPRLIYPLMLVMRGYVKRSWVLFHFFVGISLYTLPMPRPTAFTLSERDRKKQPLFLPQPGQGGLVVWYHPDNRLILKHDVSRNAMLDFGKFSTGQKRTLNSMFPEDQRRLKTARKDARKEWYKATPKRLAKKIFGRKDEASEAARRVKGEISLFLMYREYTASHQYPPTFEEWLARRMNFGEGFRRNTPTINEGGQTSYREWSKRSQESPLSIRTSRIASPSLRSRKVGMLRTVFAKFKPQKIKAIDQAAESLLSQAEKIGGNFLSINPVIRAPEITTPTLPRVLNPDEWEDVDPLTDNIKGPERMFPSLAVACVTRPQIEQKKPEETGDGLSEQENIFYMAIKEAAKDLSGFAVQPDFAKKFKYWLCKINGACIPMPLLDNAIEKYGTYLFAEQPTPIIKQGFGALVEEAKSCVFESERSSGEQKLEEPLSLCNPKNLKTSPLPRPPLSEYQRLYPPRIITRTKLTMKDIEKYSFSGNSESRDAPSSNMDDAKQPVKGANTHQKSFKEKQNRRDVFELEYAKEGFGMTRSYFREYLEEKKRIKPLNIVKRKVEDKDSSGISGDTAAKPAGTAPLTFPHSQDILRRWGDPGSDIPDGTPKPVRDAMIDLELALRQSEIEFPGPKSSENHDISRLDHPVAQKLDHEHASTISTIEERAVHHVPEKAISPNNDTYEPPRRPYLRPFGIMADGAKVRKIPEKKAGVGMTPQDVAEIVHRPAPPSTRNTKGTGSPPTPGSGFRRTYSSASSSSQKGSPPSYPSTFTTGSVGSATRTSPKASPSTRGVSPIAGLKGAEPTFKNLQPATENNRRVGSRVRPFGVLESSEQIPVLKPRSGHTPPSDPRRQNLMTRIRPTSDSEHSQAITCLSPPTQDRSRYDLSFLPKETFDADRETPGQQEARKYRTLIAFFKYHKVNMGDDLAADKATRHFEKIWASLQVEHVDLTEPRFVKKGDPTNEERSIHGDWI
ncbi:hypothetical protein ABW20_dc0110361 [Dactylellina cionopaga]|nr:hypothetical protein ABW20_dc0110361 [Dactylellina cionopaga]